MGVRTVFGVAILVGLLVAAPAGAATITVDTTADQLNEGSGCSLREAIATVDGTGYGNCGTASSSGNTIVLGATTYPLTREFFLFIGGPPSGCISTSKSRPSDNSWGELSVSGAVKDLTIEGAGPGQTVIDACKLGDRALQVMPEASVTLKGLTITNGNAQDGSAGTAGSLTGSEGGAANGGADGGGILNEGNLTVTGTAITGNHAGSGGTGGKGGPLGGSGGPGGEGGSGGAIASTGTLTVSESTISENSAGNGGGGGEATAGSTEFGLSGNGGSGSSGGNGGGGAGIANLGGTATVEGSTITANTAGAGGAGSSGQNSAATQGNGGSGGEGGFGGNGAGIAVAGSIIKHAALQATDDTIQGNVAGDGANGGNPGGAASDIFQAGKAGNGGNGGYGGGVEDLLFSATQLLNLTIAENSTGHGGQGGAASANFPAGTNGTAGHGGGVYGLSSPPTLQNTILYENQTGGDCRGAIVDGGHNLVFSKPSLKGIVTDPCELSGFTGEDPNLAPLAANGGPTQTMRLQAGSAAIDQIPALGAGCPATDQRGVARPGGTACDIGAYEVVPPAIANVRASRTSTNSVTLSATVTPNAPDATVQFQYGTTTAYGSSTTPQSASGLSPVPLLAQVSSLSPGTTYHFRVIATNPDGTSFGADETFTTTVATTATTTTTVAPVITNAAQSNRSWREGTRLASFSRKHKLSPLGTTFSFTLNEQANVSFAFTQRVGGRKVNGKCVAQTRKNHSKHACKRTVTRGTLSFTGHAGKNKVSFQGRISHASRLKPGSYTLVITATNVAGQHSATTRLSFAVVQ
ncbi:MAG TPA: fibronectin type III domain-containing protein [Solirubrobacteraceae bacterium]|nr:fibronectin type III domain-containing protein [Solirubrobacteraceae bacterium]